MCKILKFIIIVLYIFPIKAYCSATYTQLTKDSVLYTIVVSSNKVVNYGDSIQMEVKIENKGYSRVLIFDNNSSPYDKHFYEINENYICLLLGGEWRYELGIKQPEVRLLQLEKNDSHYFNYTFKFMNDVKYHDNFQHPLSNTLNFPNLVSIDYVFVYTKDTRIEICKNKSDDQYYVIDGRKHHLGLFATFQTLFFPITIQDFRCRSLKK